MHGIAYFSIRVILLKAGTVAILTSTTMNAAFGFSLGQSWFFGLLFAAFSVALDIFKAFSLLIARYGLASRRRANRMTGLAALVLFIVAVIWSLTSAIGFYGSNRGAAQAELTTAHSAWLTAKAIDASLGAETAAMRLNPRFGASDGCTWWKRASTRAFCTGYNAKAARLATARKIIAKGEPAQYDPQVAAFVSLFGFGAASVKTWLAIGFSVIAEILSALGILVATAPLPRKQKRTPAKVGKSNTKRLPRQTAAKKR